MSDAERADWDRRYAETADAEIPPPSPFLEEWLVRLPAGGRALDVACGTGRNSIRLAQAGYAVDAVDISTVAIERARREAARQGVDVSWRVADLDVLILEPATYRLVVVIRYLDRRLWPRLVDALTPDGWLLAESHFRTRVPVAGPSEEFRLESQELLRAFRPLRVIFFEERIDADPDVPERRVAAQRFVGCKGDPGY